MILIRPFLLASALIATFTLTASAQVVTPGGWGTAGSLSCSVLNTGNPTQVRAEGYSELLGDIIIMCTGGSLSGAVSVANITVALNNTHLTSRVFPNGLSEALLLIDEPGASAVVGPGGTLPQTLCSGGALGAGPGGCETQPGTVGSYYGAVLTSNPSVVPNVFQGVVSGNQVVFNGVPIVAPVTAGLARVFRITNLRGNASQFTGVFQGQAPVLASVSISTGVLLSNPVQTVGFLFGGLASTTSVRTADNSAAGTGINLSQCAATPLSPGAVLRFTEGFAASFKTRIAATASLAGAATTPNSLTVASSFAQNIPAMILPGSESGFVLPVAGGTAGLSDFGTRLKATFNTVPAGVSIYVSTVNINPQGNANVNPLTAPNLSALADAVAAGNFSPATATIAALVSGESAVAAPGDALPLRATTTTSNGVPLFGPLSVDANGTATAVWEMLASNPNAAESVDFAVFYTTTASPQPIAGTVSLSFAPTFAGVTSGALIPRMTPPATSATLINPSPCYYTVSMSSSVNPSSYRQPVTFTATVSAPPGLPLPTSIRFEDAFPGGGTTIGSAPLISGRASITTTALATGTHSIWGFFGGSAIFPVNQTVNKAATTTTLAPQPTATAAGPTTLLATVAGAFGGTPTGSVTFRNGAFPIATALLDSSGVARSSASLPIGDHTITATYNGDANFLASSGSQRFSVDPIATTVSTPVLVSGTPTLGQPLTFSATVSAGGAPATGTLTFRDGSALIGVADLNASGTGTITTSTLGAGAHLITASYSGNVDNAPATSAPLSLTIKAASTTTLTSSLNPSTPGASVSFTATVAGPAGVPTPSGSVSFADGSTPLGTISLNASAQAVLTLASGLAAGDHSIVATYNGDQQFLLSSSAPLVQRVTRPATTTTLAQGIGPAGFFLTSVVSAEHGIPTGAAQFRNVSAGTVLGTAPLVNGVATLPIAAPLPVGQTIQAVYDGDTTFAGSASPQQVFIAAVNGFSFVPGFVPDAIATIFGDGLAPSTAEAPGLPLPTTLAGIEVRIADANGRQYPAMLYYVSPRQINFVVPPAAPLGPARILIVQGETALSISVVITRSAPSLTSADGSGSGTAAAQVIRLHGDGTQDPPESVTAAAIPTAPGDRLFLVLYGTGLRHAGDGFSCALNGQSVPVLFAGAHAVYPGLDQVNLEVPAGLRGVISIACSAGGQASNTVTVNVQ